MTIQSDMALLAAGSYWDIRKEDDEFNNDAPLPEGWVVVPGYESSESSANAGSGFSARVYQNVASREIVISFAGTEFSADSKLKCNTLGFNGGGWSVGARAPSHIIQKAHAGRE